MPLFSRTKSETGSEKRMRFLDVHVSLVCEHVIYVNVRCQCEMTVREKGFLAFVPGRILKEKEGVVGR